MGVGRKVWEQTKLGCCGVVVGIHKKWPKTTSVSIMCWWVLVQGCLQMKLNYLS